MADYDPDYTPKEIKRLEEHVASVPDEDKALLQSGVQKMERGEELSEQEHEAYQKHLDLNTRETTSAGANVEQVDDQLNKGYTGKKDEKKTRISRGIRSKSKTKKKVAIAGAFAGGSIILSIVVFFLMLPLKIESIIENIDNHYSAAASQALDTEMDNAWASYVKKNVLPALGKNACHSTIDSHCVYGTEGSGPFGKLYKAWSQGNLEKKLATEYGIVLRSTGHTGGYTMSLKGHDYDIHNGDILSLMDTHSASTHEVRLAVNSALKKATLFDKVYYRFKLGKFLEAKYGIKRCIVACKIQDNFHDSVKNKKSAAQAYLVQRVISPMSDTYGLLMQCLIAGTDDACPATKPDNSDNTPDANGDQQKTSPLEQRVQSQLQAYEDKYGAEALEDLVANANDISKNGFSKYFMARVMSKVLGREVTTEGIDHLANPVQWIEDVANMVNHVDSVKKFATAYKYTAVSAGMVGTYEMYRTVAAETKSGNMDATELASFSDKLSSTAKDTNGNSSDATDSPLYASIVGSSSSQTASIFSDLFGGSASAEPIDKTYKCDNGKPVPAGQQVCPEEVLTNGSPYANDVSAATQSIPGWGLVSSSSSVVGAVTSCNGFVGDINPVCWLNSLAGLGQSVLQHVPVVSDAIAWMGSFAASITQPLFSLLFDKLIVSPISPNMSGGRATDVLAGGGDVSWHDDCQVQLGCAAISQSAMNKIQSQQVADAKQEFENQPMFARMFSTDSPYSLVSRLAVDMPTNMLTATNSSVASLLTNPLSGIANGFSSIFSGNRAFADPPATPDALGLTPVGYTSVPSHPEAYWQDNCVNGPMGTYSNGQLDVSAWLNDDANQTTDDTGQSLATVANPCLLINSMLQVGGATSDASTLPAGSQNDTGSGDSPIDGAGTVGSQGIDLQAAEDQAKRSANGGATVGYALYDSTGKLLGSYNEKTENYGASITKSMLLVAYLRQTDKGQLSSTAKAELTNMIENSDNNAANWVYEHLSDSKAAINKVASDAGMASFKLDTSDPVYTLGQSTVTANDFALFFAKIDTMFPASQKDFALGLLSNLSAADQTGLLQVSGLPGTVYSKEGWKSEPSGTRGTPYIVNQAAQFTLGDTTYGVAVTVGGVQDQAAGETVVKNIVQALVGS